MFGEGLRNNGVVCESGDVLVLVTYCVLALLDIEAKELTFGCVRRLLNAEHFENSARRSATSNSCCLIGETIVI